MQATFFKAPENDSFKIHYQIFNLMGTGIYEKTKKM